MDYSLNRRLIHAGDERGVSAFVANLVTDRRQIDFRSFCALVAKNSTLSPGEVMAVLDALPDEINFLCGLGHVVDLGRMGRAYPRFSSVAVRREEDFDPSEHIRDIRVEVRLNPEFRRLRGVAFRRVAARNRRVAKGAGL